MLKDKQKIGLALGVGSAAGLAHIGVIKSLEENGVLVNCVAGTSIGALVGACYASKLDIKSVEKAFLSVDWKKFIGLMDANIFIISKGFIQGEKVKEFLKPLIGDIQFKDLKIPLSVVATDVNSGEEIIINEGSVIDAVRASISIPVIFVPVKIGDRYLIDGGSVNPLPIDIVKRMGADYIIASNIVPSPSKRESSIEVRKSKREREKGKSLPDSIVKELKKWRISLPNSFRAIDEDIPDMFSALLQAMYASEYIVVKERLKDADIVVTPKTAHFEILEFFKAKGVIKEGYEEANKVFREQGLLNV